MCLRLHVKYLLFFLIFNKNRNTKTPQLLDFTKIRLIDVALLLVGDRTNMTRLTVTFRNCFANEPLRPPKKDFCHILLHLTGAKNI